MLVSITGRLAAGRHSTSSKRSLPLSHCDEFYHGHALPKPGSFESKTEFHTAALSSVSFDTRVPLGHTVDPGFQRRDLVLAQLPAQRHLRLFLRGDVLIEPAGCRVSGVKSK